MKIKKIYLLASLAIIALYLSVNTPYAWQYNIISALASIPKKEKIDPRIVTIETNGLESQHQNLSDSVETLKKYNPKSISIAVPLDKSYRRLILKEKLFYPIVFKHIDVFKKHGSYLFDANKSKPLIDYKNRVFGHINYKNQPPLISLPISIRYKKLDFLALPVILTADYFRKDIATLITSIGNKNNILLVRNPRPHNFKHYSIDEIIQASEYEFKNKICLIGHSDIISAQATILNSLLSNNTIRIAPDFINILALICLCIIFNIAVLRKSYTKAVIIECSSFLGAIAIYIWLFVFKNTYLDLFVPFSVFLLFVTITAVNFKKTSTMPGRLGIYTKNILSGKNRIKGFLKTFRLSENKVGILIGDMPVQEKTTDLCIGKLENLFQSYDYAYVDITQTLAMANNILLKESETLFASVTYMVIETETASIITAGGNPAIIFRDKKKDFEIIPKYETMPLGIKKINSAFQKRLDITKNDIIFLCNSGLTKTRDKTGRLLGIEKLKEVIKSNRRFSAKEITNKVFKRINLLKKVGDTQEDILFVTIKIK